jgi:hypothetical protein
MASTNYSKEERQSSGPTWLTMSMKTLAGINKGRQALRSSALSLRIEQLDMDQSGKDDTGLGRWTVMALQEICSRTRIICGYNLCRNNKPDRGTVYQQHCQFFITQLINTLCLRKLFCKDLVSQLKK